MAEVEHAGQSARRDANRAPIASGEPVGDAAPKVDATSAGTELVSVNNEIPQGCDLHEGRPPDLPASSTRVSAEEPAISAAARSLENELMKLFAQTETFGSHAPSEMVIEACTPEWIAEFEEFSSQADRLLSTEVRLIGAGQCDILRRLVEWVSLNWWLVRSVATTVIYEAFIQRLNGLCLLVKQLCELRSVSRHVRFGVAFFQCGYASHDAVWQSLRDAVDRRSGDLSPFPDGVPDLFDSLKQVAEYLGTSSSRVYDFKKIKEVHARVCIEHGGKCKYVRSEIDRWYPEWEKLRKKHKGATIRDLIRQQTSEAVKSTSASK